MMKESKIKQDKNAENTRKRQVKLENDKRNIIVNFDYQLL